MTSTATTTVGLTAAPKESDNLGPAQRWAEFARLLEDDDSLNTIILQRWLGAPVVVADLTTTPAAVLDSAEGQRRVLTLATVVDGRALAVCRAEAEVRLDLLPPWAHTVLTQTRLPLGRTLYRVGASRTRTRLRVLDPPPASPDDPACTVTGTFHLPGGQLLARVREGFTPHLLDRRATAPATGDVLDRAVDDLDATLLAALGRRRDLAHRARSVAGPTPPAYPVHDELLLIQLIAQFGRDRGSALFTHITSPTHRRPTITATTRGNDLRQKGTP